MLSIVVLALVAILTLTNQTISPAYTDGRFNIDSQIILEDIVKQYHLLPCRKY